MATRMALSPLPGVDTRWVSAPQYQGAYPEPGTEPDDESPINPDSASVLKGFRVII